MALARMILLTVIGLALGCGDDSAGGENDESGTDTEQDASSDASMGGIQSGTKITLQAGQVEGLAREGSRAFLGIPYAKPPLGALRWKAPEPIAAWDGVLETKAFGPRCSQLMTLTGAASDTEDCLHLNVWTPAEAPSKPLPVMVWFHGGSNTSGATSDDVPLNVGGKFYDGSMLAATYGVVIVSTNYRLGALGFFSHPALREEGSPVGNQGLFDQRLAVFWWIQKAVWRLSSNEAHVRVFAELHRVLRSAQRGTLCIA